MPNSIFDPLSLTPDTTCHVRSGNPTLSNTDEVELISIKMFYV